MQATKKRAAKLEAKREPVDFKEPLRMEPDGGTDPTSASPHWRRCLRDPRAAPTAPKCATATRTACDQQRSNLAMPAC